MTMTNLENVYVVYDNGSLAVFKKKKKKKKFFFFIFFLFFRVKDRIISESSWSCRTEHDWWNSMKYRHS